MESRAQALTEEFYAWELRGRGWDVWPYPVALEPPFRPFFFHGASLGSVVRDDGREATIGSRLGEGLRSLFRGTRPEALLPAEQELLEEPGADPATVGEDRVEISIRLPEGLAVSPATSLRLLTSLGLLASPISFEITGAPSAVSVAVTCGASDRDHIEGLLRAYLPEASLGESPGLHAAWDHARGEALVVEFGLADEFMLPLSDGRTSDPMVPVVSALDRIREGECAVFQVLFSPVQFPWSESLLRAVSDGAGKSFFADAPKLLDLAREKTRTPLVASIVRVGVRSEEEERRWEIARSVGAGLAQVERPGSNELIPLDPRELDPLQLEMARLDRATYRSGMLLSLAELGALAHLPDASVHSEKLEHAAAHTKAAPDVATEGELLLGTNLHQGVLREVKLTPEERARHVYVIGASGMGKSTLLLSLILQDLEAGRGCAVLDPHGDLIDEVAARVPEHRIEDVILFDPSDASRPVSFNVLEARDEIERTLLESDLAAVFRRMATSWGDQMTAVLANAVGAILASLEGGSLVDLRRFLSDRGFRGQFLASVTDREVVYFWEKEFPLLSGKPEASVLTRLNALLRGSLLRNVLSHRKGTLDLAKVMNEKGVLLARLPSGLMGEENSYLLGSLLVAKIHQVALARQAISSSARTPFALFIDEFHRFVTPTMTSVLEGARKYGLGLVLAHQTLRQVGSDDVVSSTLANAHTRVCFRLGHEDARKLSEGFSGFSALDLEDLEIGDAVARIGTARSDFNLATEIPAPGSEATAEKVREVSRQRWGVPTEDLRPREEPTVVLPEPPTVSTATDEAAAPRPKPAREEPSRPEPPPVTPGRGGPEHKYLQQLVKRLAEDRGWRATIEEVLPSGGRIDIALARGEEKLAVEVSVTTDLAHEIGNLRKCLEGGYSKAALILLHARNRRQWEDAVATELGEEANDVVVVAADEIPALLEAFDLPEEAPESTVRGYRVRLTQGSRGSSSAPREAVARVIAESVRRLRRET